MSTEFIGNEDKVDVNQRMQAGWAGSAFVDFSKGYLAYFPFTGVRF
jgi:hypothetical protein